MSSPKSRYATGASIIRESSLVAHFHQNIPEKNEHIQGKMHLKILEPIYIFLVKQSCACPGNNLENIIKTGLNQSSAKQELFHTSPLGFHGTILRLFFFNLMASFQVKIPIMASSGRPSNERQPEKEKLYGRLGFNDFKVDPQFYQASVVTFSPREKSSLFLFHSELRIFDIKFRDTGFGENTTLEIGATHFNNTSQLLRKYENYVPEDCHLGSKTLDRGLCFNYSSFHSAYVAAVQNHYLILLLLQFGDTFQKTFNKKYTYSWNHAAVKCESFGGVLPAFSSRDDLYHLVCMVKYSRHILDSSAFFIGMKSKVQKYTCF